MTFAASQPQPTKKVADQGRVLFDFTSFVALSEALSGAVVTATVYSGVDPLPQNIVSGAASIGGAGNKQVSQLIVGGISGVIYQLVCEVQTGLGQRLHLSSYLAVVPDLS